MHLDRDYRGNANNTITVNGKTIVNPLRQEVVTVRAINPGEYVANVNYYENKDAPADETSDHPRAGQPVVATLSVIKVNPKAEVVFYGQATLTHKGEETTLVRFTVAPDGSVTNINTLPKSLVTTF